MQKCLTVWTVGFLVAICGGMPTIVIAAPKTKEGFPEKTTPVTSTGDPDLSAQIDRMAIELKDMIGDIRQIFDTLNSAYKACRNMKTTSKIYLTHLDAGKAADQHLTRVERRGEKMADDLSRDSLRKLRITRKKVDTIKVRVDEALERSRRAREHVFQLARALDQNIEEELNPMVKEAESLQIAMTDVFQEIADVEKEIEAES